MLAIVFTLMLAGMSAPLWFDGLVWVTLRDYLRDWWDEYSHDKLQSHNESRALLMPYVSWSDTVAHTRYPTCVERVIHEVNQ